jgi:hypothetical protein
MAALASGNIFIPSDNFDITKGDAVEIDGATGAVVQALSFARATKGDILPSGIFCLAVESGASTLLASISIYARDGLTVLAAITTWSVGSRSALCPVFAWGAEHFFVLIPKNAGDPFVTLHKIATDGTVAQSWNLPVNADFADNLAISPDGTIAYYCFDQTNTPIYAFDLEAEAALPNLVAATAGRHWSKNIVVDADGNLLIPMYDNATYPQSYLHKYSPAGALLDAFDIEDTNYEVPEVFTDADPLYVWVRNFPDGDGFTSKFFRFLISDGTLDRSFTVDTLEGSGQVPSTCPNLMLRGDDACTLEQPSLGCWGDEVPSVACASDGERAKAGCWSAQSLPPSVGLTE